MEPSASLGARAQDTFVVTEADTAIAVGSGTVAVLGTPVLIAWLEAVTVAAAPAAAGFVSLGVHIDVAHIAPSLVGTEVEVTAELTSIDGLRLGFNVAARNVGTGTVVATGRVDRVVVDQARFLARAQQQ